MRRFYTIGHSTRSAAEFLDLLLGAAVQLLVDVRRYPGSRRHPHFNREPLRELLRPAGISYLHLPELGGRRTAVPASLNGFWRNASFRAYADYMSTPEFAAALRRLESLPAQQSPVLLCAEAVPWRCHRQLIADALVARGHEVQHILAAHRSERHALHPGARLNTEGSLVYPAMLDGQSSIFEQENQDG
jgi:uncharacterized protein (DUF488 family)